MTATDSNTFVMPKPAIGDVVLFSKDYKNFSDPVVGWVMQEPGDTTISIVTFTPEGYALVCHSCHHRADPALQGDHGWQDLGVWDFTEATNCIRKLKANEGSSARKSTK